MDFPVLDVSEAYPRSPAFGIRVCAVRRLSVVGGKLSRSEIRFFRTGPDCLEGRLMAAMA
ncbi:hypothetical protein [Azospirillum palustre]